MKPRHTAEQSTVRVNKAQAMGKKGFAIVASAIGGNPVDKKAFEAPLQKSLDIVEPAPLRASEPVIIMTKPVEVVEVKPEPVKTAPISWNIPKVSAVMASPVEVTTKVAVTIEAVKVPTEARGERKTSAGYQSLANLAGITTATAEVKKPRVIMTASKTCPTDPADLTQCDSCQ